MGDHCDPETAEGSPHSYAYGKQKHRHDDSRACGAKTIVVGQSSVYVDGKLWAVKDDICDHGDGQLINTFTGVYIGGIPVIVHTADQAQPDDLCTPPAGDGGGGDGGGGL